MSDLKPPAPRPCGSCPYRVDVPAGLWAAEEYHRLPAYDRDTMGQPAAPFACHQQDGRMCAGWVACHDQGQLLSLRIWGLSASAEDIDAVLDYETDVEVFDSGQEAAEHGLSGVAAPDARARRMIATLTRKQELRVASDKDA